MWLSCRAFWRVCDSTLRLRLISTSFPVAMAEAEKPPDEERLVDTESDERSGDVPKVPKLQTHTSDTTSSRDERPVPELRKHQTDTGGRGTKEDLKESNVMRVLKVQQRAEQYVSMLREEKRKLYRCGKKYTTLGTVSTLKEDIESGHVIQNDALREGDDPELCSKVSLWRGDITRLEIDAIVNAANSSLLGGGGVDGAIHSAAGLMLREECETLGGCSAGDAKVTAGYKLPAKYVIHTVGPMMEKSRVLQSCYLRSFQLVKENVIRSVAFPCIATGIYGYPNEKAAHIALETTKEWLMEHKVEVDRVVFCVFLDRDHRIYSELMPKYFPTATPPLPPSKSRREEKGEGREGARQRGSDGSSPSEEMDQSGMACQRAGGPSGDEERGHFEKDSSPNEEGVRETPADEPGWLFSLIQRLLAWLTRWWGTTVRRG